MGNQVFLPKKQTADKEREINFSDQIAYKKFQEPKQGSFYFA